MAELLKGKAVADALTEKNIETVEKMKPLAEPALEVVYNGTVKFERVGRDRKKVSVYAVE